MKLTVRRIRWNLLAILALATSTAAGCVAGPPIDAESTTTTTSWWTKTAPTRTVTAAATLPPEYEGIDRSDPDLTARVVMRLWFAWNTNTDAGPSDAAARSAPLLSSELSSLITGTVPIIGAGARWTEWARAHATIAVDVEPSQALVPPQDARSAVRKFLITQSVFDPYGVLLDTVERTVTVRLQFSARGWEVSGVDEF